MNNMPWFGYAGDRSLVEKLRENDEAEAYLSERRKRLEADLKDKDKKKGEPYKGRAFSGTDVTCLALLMIATSPWTGLQVIKSMSYLATQYADAFAHFAK